MKRKKPITLTGTERKGSLWRFDLLTRTLRMETEMCIALTIKMIGGKKRRRKSKREIVNCPRRLFEESCSD